MALYIRKGGKGVVDASLEGMNPGDKYIDEAEHQALADYFGSAPVVEDVPMTEAEIDELADEMDELEDELEEVRAHAADAGLELVEE